MKIQTLYIFNNKLYQNLHITFQNWFWKWFYPNCVYHKRSNVTSNMYDNITEWYLDKGVFLLLLMFNKGLMQPGTTYAYPVLNLFKPNMSDVNNFIY